MITDEYKKALLDLHSTPGWGITGGAYSGDSIVAYLNGVPNIRTILDYGCGDGSLKKWVEDRGITKEWTLYDPGVEEFSARPKGPFDFVITTDVLEHVEEEHLDAVIDDLNDLTGKFLYNEVACYLTNSVFQSGPYKGQDVHISLKAPDEWKLRLARPNMGLMVSHACVHDGWKVRYLSVQEKI